MWQFIVMAVFVLVIAGIKLEGLRLTSSLNNLFYAENADDYEDDYEDSDELVATNEDDLSNNGDSEVFSNFALPKTSNGVKLPSIQEERVTIDEAYAAIDSIYNRSDKR